MTRTRRPKSKKVQQLTESIPSRFTQIESKLYLKLTVLQRGLIDKLIKRGKEIETKLLLAILGLKLKPKYQKLYPEIIFAGGQSDPGTLKLVLPQSLLNQLFKLQMIKIKQETI